MKRKKGFTLIEALLAVVILVIALVGTSAFFYANSKDTERAKVKRLATWSAVDKLEQLKSTEWNSLVDSVDSETILLFETPARRKTTIVTVNENGVTLKKLSVDVEWATGNVSMTTYVAEQ